LGIVNCLIEKVIYEQEARGSKEYGVHKFVKPFFFATMICLGVALSLVAYILVSWSGRDGFPPVTSLPRKTMPMFFISGVFGLFQGVMSSIVTALVGVSIDYMMRSATLIGVCLIARFYFKRRFRRNEWSGVALVGLAMLLVGVSGVLNAGNSVTILVSKRWAIVIIALKAISQLTYSIRLSFEQYFSQHERFDIMLISGLENLWAFVIGAFVLLPISHRIPGPVDLGLHEDIFDTFSQLRHSSTIILLLGLAVCIECGYSISSVALTEATSAVARTLIEAFRTFLIWVLQLGLFYGLSKSKRLHGYRGIGEEWSDGSWVQLLGYFTLMVGLLVYQGVLTKKPDIPEEPHVLEAELVVSL
jgi:hypothetical protein